MPTIRTPSASQIAPTSLTKNKPYMELSFGIHNIFKVLTVEFIDRLSYNDHANTQKYGIRFGIYLSF